MFSLGLLDDGFDSTAAVLVALNVLWCGVGDLKLVESVLSVDLPLDLWGAPRLFSWLRPSLVCFDGLLDCELDVVEVL